MIDESIQEIPGEQLVDAQKAIAEAWGPEVDDKLENLLEFRIVTSDEGVRSTQRQRVIIYYKPRKDFDSLVNEFETEIGKQHKRLQIKTCKVEGENELVELSDEEFEEEFRFLEDNSNEDARPLLEFLGEGHIEVEEHLRLGNAVIAELTPEQIKTIAQRSDISRIEGEKTMILELDQSAVTVKVVEAREKHGVGTGKAIIVAVLDGEVDSTHPDLQGRVVQKKNYTEEPWGNPSKHGTHVAGIVAGNGAVYKGMAPEAIIWNYKIYPSKDTQSKEGSRSADAIEDAVKDGAQVINCSWGVSETNLDGKSIWAVTAERATRLGVVLVKSAGNSGPEERTITSPADALGDVIVVGAVGREGSGITEFSSRGPTADNRPKPDLCAPGEQIMSAKEGGEYRRLSGTSMAAPHISGIAALMLERNPKLKPWQIKKILMDSAQRQNAEFDQNAQGAGLVDVVNAVKVSGQPVPEEGMLECTLLAERLLRERLTIILKNTGTTNLTQVRGRLESIPEIRVTQAEGDFGSVRLGGQGEATYEVVVSPETKPGRYELTLQATFTTAAGISKTIPCKVTHEVGKPRT